LVKLLLAKGADPNAAGGEPVGAGMTTFQRALVVIPRQSLTASVP
jgi:hypothetical protein